MRKNHARQLESLQASLETEIKAKSDLVSICTSLISLTTSETWTSDVCFLLFFWALKNMKQRKCNELGASCCCLPRPFGEPTNSLEFSFGLS